MDVRRSPSREGLYFSANPYMGCYDENSTIIAESPPTHPGNASDSGPPYPLEKAKMGTMLAPKVFLTLNQKGSLTSLTRYSSHAHAERDAK